MDGRKPKTKKEITVHPELIIYELKMKGWPQTKIARFYGVSRQMVWMVIHSKTESRQLKLIIATILEKEVSEIWK